MSGERGCTWDNLSLWRDELAMGRGENWKRRTTRVRHDELVYLRTFFKTFPEHRVRSQQSGMCASADKEKKRSMRFSEEMIVE